MTPHGREGRIAATVNPKCRRNAARIEGPVNRDTIRARVREWPEGMNLQPLLISLARSISPRKLRLVSACLCRRVAHLLPDEECRSAIEVAERYADRWVKRLELAAAHEIVRAAWERVRGVLGVSRTDAPRCAVLALLRLTHPTKRRYADSVADSCTAACGCTEGLTGYSERHRAECAAQKQLLLDVLPASEFDPVWRTSSAVALARAVYAERAFDRLPILADALEEAGCSDPLVLDHCRGPGPHARGCWVVDAVLGNE